MGKEELLAKRKASRKAHEKENKALKTKKNWYPVSNLKKHFTRKCKLPKEPHIHAPLTPGQIVILLSGRFRGRRVIFLKKLQSGLLLVIGPYKYNGVPLKRVNPAYVLPTETKIKLSGKEADAIDDKFFEKRTDIERKSEKDFFEDDKVKKKRIDENRKTKQVLVGAAIKTVVDSTPMLKEYLRNRFSLKNGDLPHKMKF